jgi:hypothetical protein
MAAKPKCWKSGSDPIVPRQILFLAEPDRDRTLGPITKLYSSIYEDITGLCEQSGRPNGDSYSLVSVCSLNEFKAGI